MIPGLPPPHGPHYVPPLHMGEGHAAAGTQAAAAALGGDAAAAVAGAPTAATRTATVGVSPKFEKMLKDILAGTVGGMAITAVGHPFDTVKVLLQTQPTHPRPLYSGMMDCFRKVVTQQGIAGLYQGVYSTLLGQMALRGALFIAYDQAKTAVGAAHDRPLSFFAAGGLAWGAVSIVECPIDFYKSQMQSEILRWKRAKVAGTLDSYKPVYSSQWQVVRASFAHNGVLGPYQGFGATVARNVPAAALYFGSNEALKAALARAAGREAGDNTLTEMIAAGGLAGIALWAVTYPIDVIKSALMTDAIPRAERKYAGMLDCARQLYAAGGIGRFYMGLRPCLVRAVAGNAVMLPVVDIARIALG